MFESGDQGGCPPLLDEPELTEEQWQAQVDALIAADPEHDAWLALEPLVPLGEDPFLPAAPVDPQQLIARGETEPINPTLIGQLDAIDPTTVTEDQAVGLSVAWDRVANYAHARRGLAVNRAVACAPDTKDIPRELAAAAQLGAALGLGSGGTDTLIADAAQIATMLPATQTMALAGDLPWRKAASIASATFGMTAQQARRVEDKVLAKAWERSPARHDAAVRRARDQVDPDRSDRDRKDRERDIRLVIDHYGAGMGQAFIDAPSEWLDAIKAGATSYARRLKAAGDPRPLEILRVYFLYQAAMSQLSHGNPAHCTQHCDPLPPDPNDPDDGPEPPDDHGDGGSDRDSGPDRDTDPGGAAPVEPAEPAAPSTPTQHGRPVAVHVVWDLTSLLGLTNHCGLLRDSDTMLPPSAMRDLLVGGARLRRMVIDPDTGEQLDLTPVTWLLAPTDGRAHRQPVVLTVTTTARLDDLPDDVRAALNAVEPALAAMLTELLDYPLTAEDLDHHPDAETPTPALAEYTANRAGHPVNPAAGPTAASAGDLDHHQSRKDGGRTTRINLGPFVRRWHRLKTFADWTVLQTKRAWIWTSPTGRRYTIEPHDYRLGP